MSYLRSVGEPVADFAHALTLDSPVTKFSRFWISYILFTVIIFTVSLCTTNVHEHERATATSRAIATVLDCDSLPREVNF